MDKITETKVEKIKRTHTFYCDGCGELIGSKDEYDDGYYDEIGAYEQSMYVKLIYNAPGGWYSVKKHLCPDCATKMSNDIIAKLEELGFVKEK